MCVKLTSYFGLSVALMNEDGQSVRQKECQLVKQSGLQTGVGTETGREREKQCCSCGEGCGRPQ